MKNTITQVLQQLDEWCVDFTNTQTFNAALKDVRIEIDAKKIRSLLSLAIVDMKVYSRLKVALGNNAHYAINDLAKEMHDDNGIDLALASVNLLPILFAKLYERTG